MMDKWEEKIHAEYGKKSKLQKTLYTTSSAPPFIHQRFSNHQPKLQTPNFKLQTSNSKLKKLHP
jgi:hypothetical protein